MPHPIMRPASADLASDQPTVWLRVRIGSPYRERGRVWDSGAQLIARAPGAARSRGGNAMPIPIAAPPVATVSIGAIVAFLENEPSISSMNFYYSGIRIWPGIFRSNLPDALLRRKILCKTTMFIEDGAGASYDSQADIVKLRKGFNVSNIPDQGVLIHELTHAFLDMQMIPGLMRKTYEAVGYLTQATFLEMNGYNPLGNVKDILLAAQSIAVKTIIPGRYKITEDDAQRLEGVIARNPLYRKDPSNPVISNGFTRNARDSLVRSVTGDEIR